MEHIPLCLGFAPLRIAVISVRAPCETHQKSLELSQPVYTILSSYSYLLFTIFFIVKARTKKEVTVSTSSRYSLSVLFHITTATAAELTIQKATILRRPF